MHNNKCKRINTRALFEEFSIELKNLELTEKGLHLSSMELYKPGDDIFDDPDLELKDLDVDECDILYIIDKSSSILIHHRDFEKLRFPDYKPGSLAAVIEEPEGIAVDENSVYLIGKFKTPNGYRREGLVALGKKDLKFLWKILIGPDGFSLKGLKDLDMDSKGNLYVLEKSRNRILKVSLSNREKSFFEIDRGELHEPENIYVDKEGVLHVSDAVSEYLELGTDGTFKKSEVTPSIKEIISRRRAHDSKKNMYLIETEKRWIETEKRWIEIDRLRFLENVKENCPDPEGAFRGTYTSKCIDSKEQNTRWYRFMLEGSFPSGTKVEFRYHISEKLLQEKELKELPESEWEEGLPGSSAVQGEEKRDALFLTKQEGRYLWFRIILTGTEKLSPVISSITIFFPKFSYLDYLPSVYRDDSANRDFLDHFLAIFESLFLEIDFKIDYLSKWFDAAGTPPEFLEWLGSWVGADRGREESSARKKVPEAKQREFISRAVSLYRERGTREGLENLIFFYTGKKPIIIENLPVSCKEEKSGNESIKENLLYFPPEASLLNRLFGGEGFSFVVLFKEKLEKADLELIRDIIEEEKPAHTTYKIKVLEPWFYLDGYTYLGINTRLWRPEFLLERSSVLGRDTALGVEKSPNIAKEGLNNNHANLTGHLTDDLAGQ